MRSATELKVQVQLLDISSDMATASTPESIKPYITNISNKHLVLLTSVLNASSNWLLLRYLGALLPRSPLQTESSLDSNIVIFLSFLRSWDFWQDGARRIGLNLLRSRQTGDLLYIDGLAGCFTGSSDITGDVPSGQNILSVLDPSAKGIDEVSHRALGLARQTKPGANVVFLVDGLDFLLASGGAEATALLDLVGTLRSEVFAVLISASADAPLLQQPSTTPLEQDHMAFLVTLAHQASFTLSTRLLSTGAAKDVTGVLRITRGTEPIEEKELLYFVGSDGSVTAFERGSAESNT